MGLGVSKQKHPRAKKRFLIPDRVPRGYEIPISINSKEAEPEKGKFRRLGLDVAVNATWLAMYWALLEGNTQDEAALDIDPGLAI